MESGLRATTAPPIRSKVITKCLYPLKFLMKSLKQLWCNINSPSSHRIISSSILSCGCKCARVGVQQHSPNWFRWPVLCKWACSVAHGTVWLLGIVAQRLCLSFVHILQKSQLIKVGARGEGTVAFEREDPHPSPSTHLFHRGQFWKWDQVPRLQLVSCYSLSLISHKCIWARRRSIIHNSCVLISVVKSFAALTLNTVLSVLFK